jgi:hypothetical protein
MELAQAQRAFVLSVLKPSGSVTAVILIFRWIDITDLGNCMRDCATSLGHVLATEAKHRRASEEY